MTAGGGSSLLGRIAAWLIAVSLLAVVMAGGLLYLEFGDTDTGLRQRTLHEQAQRVARYLVAQNSEAGDVPPDLAASLTSSGSRFAVLDSSGRLIKGSDGVVAPLHPIEPAEASASEYFALTQREGRDLFGVTEQVVVAGKTLWIQVASNDEEVHLDTVIEEFIDHLAWIWVPFVFVLLLVNLLVIHLGLRPLRAVSAKAAAIGPGTVWQRLPISGLPREIAPLITAVNAALDRLEEGYRAQQEFIMDAAHELRTPLAVLCAHLATLEDRGVAAALQEDAGAMVRLVNQLLDMARVGALHVDASECTDLQALAVDVATHLAPLAVARQRLIEVVGSDRPVLVKGVRDSLFRAVRNLAENALAHTPVGSTVSIEVTDAPSLSVSDRGPGIPVEQRSAIFQRYWQGNRDRGGGVGLGLAIVARTVAAHGGEIAVGDADGGGAVVTIRFPALSSDPSPSVKIA